VTVGTAAVVGPRRFEVPKVNGDPAAARRVAAACRDLAEAIAGTQRQVTHVISELTATWHGEGRRGIDGPAEDFVATAATATRRLRETADHLDAYATRLEHAHHHHGFSLHKLLVIGAVATVGLTTIVVTMGAASAIEAAAATAAVSGAIEAAGAAATADVAAAAGVDSAFADLSWLRPLLRFVAPNLTQFAWGSVGSAGYDQVSRGRIRWGRALEAGGIAFVAGVAAAKGNEVLEGSAWLRTTPAIAQRAAPHLVESTSWAGAEAAHEASTGHRLSPIGISEAFVIAGGGSYAHDELEARDLWPERRDYRREALVGLLHRQGKIVDPEIAHEVALLRQTTRELRRGSIDLRLNEGVGHTIGRHVAKPEAYLLGRVRGDRLRFASTYWSEPSAQDAIEQTLAAHKDTVRAWLKAGSDDPLRLQWKLPYNVGYGVDRHDRVRFVRTATVILIRDRSGISLLTSYPLGR